uniref:Fucosyltransferase n=1 Tax=Macrostomum lignano TaxID=282301 RepID=A0A1I8JIF9_9PLAT
MRIGLFCYFRRWNSLISSARGRRQLRWLLAACCLTVLLGWQILMQNDMELRDLAALVRDRNAAAEIQFALSENSPLATSVGCPANATCIGLATRIFRSYSYWNEVLQPGLVPACASNCRLIADHSQAHALLFHAYDLPSRRRLRRMRQTLPRNQLWIYYSIESPMQMTTQRCGQHCLKATWLSFVDDTLAYFKQFTFPSYLLREYPDTTEEATYFNWTMTYRRDSTIYTPYARFEPVVSATGEKHSGPIALPPKVSLAEKRFLSFIAVSNCYPSNRRQEILTELAKHMELHFYGRCGDRVLPDSQSMVDLSRQYYFHLSFENVFCRDYITEKFYSNGLWGHAVPVAFAGYSKEELEAVAPPHSFIYAGDFKSPAELAEHLKSLAANSEKYNAYHRWRRTFGFVDNYRNPSYNVFCQICRKLQQAPNTAAEVDLNKFYNISQQCRPLDYNPFSAHKVELIS